MDRLRRENITSSNSDLANSISPPTVRFTTDTAAIAANIFNFSSAASQKSITDSPRIY